MRIPLAALGLMLSLSLAACGTFGGFRSSVFWDD